MVIKHTPGLCALTITVVHSVGRYYLVKVFNQVLHPALRFIWSSYRAQVVLTGRMAWNKKLRSNEMAVFAPNKTHSARAEDKNLILFTQFCMNLLTLFIDTNPNQKYFLYFSWQITFFSRELSLLPDEFEQLFRSRRVKPNYFDRQVA